MRDIARYPGGAMKKKLIIFCAIIIPLGLFISFLLYTDIMMVQLPVLVQKNPKITFVIGDATYRKTSSDKWEIAIVGQELKYGSEVKTGKNSEVDIRFQGNTAVRISENSVMRIDDMSIRKILITLNQGSMFGKFEKLFKDYGITIKTPTTIAAVRGTELGFNVKKDADEMKKLEKERKKNDGAEEQTAEIEPLYITTVYSLSGITELYNPKFEEQKVLLSYQNRLVIKENEAPGDPEKMTDDEIATIRSKLNSIHAEEVLFISDKINFNVGSANILPDSNEELAKIIKIIKTKNVRIRIEGHTDTQGTAAFNQTLSVKRAQSIKEYLVNNGIKPDKLVIAGYGSSKPVASNRTNQGRAMNRRVEFIIVE